MAQKLKLVLVGTIIVDDYDALEAGVSRKLGAVLEPNEEGRHVFRMTGEAFEVNDRAEYRRHVARGEMLPADAATAKVLGVAFEAPPAPTKADAKAAGKDK